MNMRLHGHITSVSKGAAWAIICSMYPDEEWAYNQTLSDRAGYNIYSHVVNSKDDNPNDHVSDLGTRLELNVGAESANIWYQ